VFNEFLKDIEYKGERFKLVEYSDGPAIKHGDDCFLWINKHNNWDYYFERSSSEKFPQKECFHKDEELKEIVYICRTMLGNLEATEQ
jgi:hypothetical protein